MEKEFVPYEQVLEIKKLGFDEPCYSAYIRGTRKNLSKPQVFVESIDFNKDFTFVSAPTFSQSFRWFRENHDLCSHVRMFDGKFTFEINEVEFVLQSKETHEEAELACLTKLIEIVEQTKR